VAAVALSGILTAQAFPAVDLGILAWLSLAPLFAALQGVSPRRGAALGFLHGAIFFGLLVYWIPAVVTVYGRLPGIVGLGVGALLVAVLALFHSLFGAAQAWLYRCLGPGALLAAPAAWVSISEWPRLWPVGGFPWGYLGYTQHASDLFLPLAPWTGVFGLSLLLASFNAAVCGVLAPLGARRSRRFRAVSLAAGSLLLLGAAGAGLSARVPAGEASISVAAVQGNVLQDEKWQAENRGTILRRHLEMTEEAARSGAGLILWPESSTLELLEESPALLERLADIARRHQTALLLGSVHRLPEGGYTNAAFLLTDRRDLSDRYDKIRLVPFGETVPLRSVLFFIKPLVEAVGDFTPGTDPGPLGRQLHLAGETEPATPFGVAICYEVIYPHLVARQVRAGATFLTTITNDAWFGRTSAPAQHFAMAAFRAAEARRWLVRAANTGISGLVAPTGKVVQATPLFRTALVQGAIEPRRELTWATRHPHAVPGACVIILALAATAALGGKSAKPWTSNSANSTMI
jgi:apolipoprotein N-acyltransferase